MTPLVIGIDPGLTGAIATISPVGVIELHDCPIFTIGKRHTCDPAGMAKLFHHFRARHPTLLVGLEKVHSMPGQGVASVFTFGEGFGVWLGILAALNVPHQLITPQRWKRVMMDGQGDKDKDASRLVAMRMFPEKSDRLNLKKHHGRADALLIAEYLRRQIVKQ